MVKSILKFYEKGHRLKFEGHQENFDNGKMQKSTLSFGETCLLFYGLKIENFYQPKTNYKF